MPRRSIIIATYNRADLLANAINRARASATDVEIIVINDSLSDHSAELCASYSEVHYVRNNRNQGIAGGRNIGLVHSSSEPITFLEDDDIRLANSLSRQIEMLDAEPTAVLAHGQALVADSNRRLTSQIYPFECPEGDILWLIVQLKFILCGAAVVRRSKSFRDVGLLNPTASGVDDWDLWVRMSSCFSVIASPELVLIWRQSTPKFGHGSSLASHIVPLAIRRFQQWMRSDRALASARARRRGWQGFSQTMAQHLIYQSLRAAVYGNLAESINALLLLRNLDPSALALVSKRRLSSLLLKRAQYPMSHTRQVERKLCE